MENQIKNSELNPALEKALIELESHGFTVAIADGSREGYLAIHIAKTNIEPPMEIAIDVGEEYIPELTKTIIGFYADELANEPAATVS